MGVAAWGGSDGVYFDVVKLSAGGWQFGNLAPTGTAATKHHHTFDFKFSQILSDFSLIITQTRTRQHGLLAHICERSPAELHGTRVQESLFTAGPPCHRRENLPFPQNRYAIPARITGTS